MRNTGLKPFSIGRRNAATPIITERVDSSKFKVSSKQYSEFLDSKGLKTFAKVAIVRPTGANVKPVVALRDSLQKIHNEKIVSVR